jgi:Carboxypeptidase regulatory-like domain
MQSAFRPALTRIILAFFVLAIMLGMPTFMAAQDAASLTGVVTDASGAVVPDVNVKLVDTKTNTSYEAKTSSVGSYVFHDLLPGPGYQVTFTKDGFDTVTVPKLYLAVNTAHTQNVQLKVGRSSETIEVKGEGSAVSLDTTDAAVGNSFDMNMVHELPVQLRDSPAALLAYQPGVVYTPVLGPDDPNQSRAGSVTGSRTDQSNITLDGLDVNDFAGGFAFTIVGNAPVDSIQEFSSEVANPLSAEGRGSGAQMNLVTKSGTNTFHGSGYEYYRTRGFEANDFFNNFATPIVPRQALVRNQFGAAIGGPVIKNKLFFFFNYEGRRDAQSVQVTQTVPMSSFSAGSVAYVNDSLNPNNNLPCSASNLAPSCVSVLTPTQVAALDPLAIGPAPALTGFLQSRYPAPNSTAVGDGLNTAGYVFNSPANDTLNDYVVKVDYNLTDKMKIFVRGSLVRNFSVGNGGASVQFPGDPLTFYSTDHSYAYVFGHTWTISNTKVNQFIYGENRQVLNFPVVYAPLGTTVFGFDASGTGSNYLTSPYLTPSTQARTIPIPIVRDDFTYVRGKHTFQVGGSFKPIETTYKLVSDFNTATIGLGGGLQSFDSSPTLRPANAATDSISENLYDSAFAFILGNYGQVSSSFNNNKQLQPLPQGTGHVRHYRYYETELYLQDSWKARTDLTLTYGMRYQFNSVSYEVNGLEAGPNLDFSQAIDPRIANGQAGNTGCPGASCGLVNPLLYYSLAGKANNAPSLYNPDWHDFQPRLAFAFNPSGVSGLLGRLLGDRKTVIRGGAAIVDDHTMVNALNFLQDQNTWILQNSSSVLYGEQPTAAADLATDPRFNGLSLPAGSVATPAPIVTPYAPYLSSTPLENPAYGDVYGLESANPFNYSIDRTLKTPYSETISFGIQRELPGNFQLEASYVGRMAHRLLAQSDGMQTVDFMDPASGQLLSQAFANLTTQVRNQVPNPITGYSVTPIPFFENQIPMATAFGFPSATNFVANDVEPYVGRGDVADSLQLLNEYNFYDGIGLNPGVGLNPQFGTALYMTNKGYSNYNGLLATLHKKMSQGLVYDVNYTWAHSLDNISAPANEAFGSNGAGGILCDSIHIGVCYGNSDFDVQQSVTADGVYELPIGRGKAFGGSVSRAVDEVIGGWSISGLVSWRTGLAFQTVANAFPISFANNVPAEFNGDNAALKVDTHYEINSASGNPSIQLFKNQGAALGAFSGPLGLEAGSRNNLRGPHYSNFDIGLMKHFPITEAVRVELRADAFNAMNHPNMALPGAFATADITSPSTFGVISSTTGEQPFRVLQVAFRLDF